MRSALIAADPDAGVRDVVLVDPWSDLRNPGESEQQQIQAITSQLLREVSSGHPMYRMAFTVIGQSTACS